MKNFMLSAALASVITIPSVVQAEPANPQEFPGLGAVFKVTVECTYNYYRYPIFETYARATVKDSAIDYAQSVASDFEDYYYGAECDVILTNPGGRERVIN